MQSTPMVEEPKDMIAKPEALESTMTFQLEHDNAERRKAVQCAISLQWNKMIRRRHVPRQWDTNAK